MLYFAFEQCLPTKWRRKAMNIAITSLLPYLEQKVNYHQQKIKHGFPMNYRWIVYVTPKFPSYKLVISDRIVSKRAR